MKRRTDLCSLGAVFEIIECGPSRLAGEQAVL